MGFVGRRDEDIVLSVSSVCVKGSEDPIDTLLGWPAPPRPDPPSGREAGESNPVDSRGRASWYDTPMDEAIPDQHRAPELVVFTDDAMVDHDPGPGHPERPARLASLQASLRDTPVEGLRWMTPDPASREAITAIHAETYVDGLIARRGERLQLDPDTAVSEGSIDAALLAGSQVDELVLGDLRLSGQSQTRALVV